MRMYRKRIPALLLAVVILLGVLPVSAAAEEPRPFTAVISSEKGSVGSTVEVTITLENNPGIAAFAGEVYYDTGLLRLDTVTYGEAVSGNAIEPQKKTSPVFLSMNFGTSELLEDVTFATLTFTLLEIEGRQAVSPIYFAFDPEDVCNLHEVNVPLTVENGMVVIYDGLPGDINRDGAVNQKDAIRLLQYLARWEVEADEAALDCNGDGKTNQKDAIRLLQYLAHWDVELFRGCFHAAMEYHEAVPATCTADGSNAYWYCDTCKTYFGDAAGTAELIWEDIVVPHRGHSMEFRSALTSTCTEDGHIAHWHCLACDRYYSDESGTTELTRDKVILPAFGHDVDYHPANPASCTKDGNPAYYECSACGKRFTDRDGIIKIDDVILPAFGHTLNYHPANPASCTEDGNRAYYECSTCGRYYFDAAGKTELKWSEIFLRHGHKLKYIPETPAGCEEDGEKEHYECSVCGGCFADDEALIPVEPEELLLPHPGHEIVTIPAIPPTYTQPGRTEGEKCAVCGEILTEPQPIPIVPGEFSIIYRNLKGAPNTENPSSYDTRVGVSHLNPPGASLGRIFLGWYTEEIGGMLVDRIAPGTTGEIILYAHWELIRYPIHYDCGEHGVNHPDNPTTYTVEDVIYLSGAGSENENLKFDYWRDQNGNRVDVIQNHTGEIELTARYKWNVITNRPVPYAEIPDPVYPQRSVAHNDGSDIYYIAYYLGRVENFVVSVGDFRHYNGIGQQTMESAARKSDSSTVAKTVTESTDQTDTTRCAIEENISKSTSTTGTGTGGIEAFGAKVEVSHSITKSLETSLGVTEEWVKSHSLTTGNSQTEEFTVVAEEERTESYVLDSSCPTGYYRRVNTCSVDVFAVVVYNAKQNAYYVDTLNLVNDPMIGMWEYSKDPQFPAAHIDLPELDTEDLLGQIEQILTDSASGVSVGFERETETMTLDFTGVWQSAGSEAAAFAWLDQGVLTLYPEAGGVPISKLRLIGAYNTEDTRFDSLSVKLDERWTEDALRIELENMGVYTAGTHGFVDLSECSEEVELTLAYTGRNEIVGHNGKASAEAQSALIGQKVAFVSEDAEASLILRGGSGWTPSAAGADGQDGAAAVQADSLTVDTCGELKLYGGSGGNGVKGADGAAGGTNDSAVWYKNVGGGLFGIGSQVLYYYNKAYKGANGQAGGSGGHGGAALRCEAVEIENGTLSLYYGSGGNGGTGGTGGAGGKGHDYYARWDFGDILHAHDPGVGGDGGQGGVGGDAGRSVTGGYSFADERIKVYPGADGVPGRGGAGGAAGIGGKGGSTNLTFTSYWSSDAPNGKKGNDGLSGGYKT